VSGFVTAWEGNAVKALQCAASSVRVGKGEKWQGLDGSHGRVALGPSGRVVALQSW